MVEGFVSFSSWRLYVFAKGQFCALALPSYFYTGILSCHPFETGIHSPSSEIILCSFSLGAIKEKWMLTSCTSRWPDQKWSEMLEIRRIFIPPLFYQFFSPLKVHAFIFMLSEWLTLSSSLWWLIAPTFCKSFFHCTVCVTWSCMCKLIAG